MGGCAGAAAGLLLILCRLEFAGTWAMYCPICRNRCLGGRLRRRDWGYGPMTVLIIVLGLNRRGSTVEDCVSKMVFAALRGLVIGPVAVTLVGFVLVRDDRSALAFLCVLLLGSRAIGVGPIVGALVAGLLNRLAPVEPVDRRDRNVSHRRNYTRAGVSCGSGDRGYCCLTALSETCRDGVARTLPRREYDGCLSQARALPWKRQNGMYSVFLKKRRQRNVFRSTKPKGDFPNEAEC